MHKHCSFDMDVPLEVQPRRTLEVGVLAALDELLEVFAPRVLWAQIDDAETIEIKRVKTTPSWGTQALWDGEQMLLGAVTTSCPPGPAADMIRELSRHLTGRTIRSVFISADGALRHRAPDTSQANWHGRWKIDTPPALIDLIAVRLQWTDEMHAFEFDLANGGYPLTSARLAPDGSLDDGDLAAAAANRAMILPVLERVPACLGLVPGEFCWSIGGDFGPLYPRDEAEMRGIWLPRLNGAAGM
jgi:hypothetical protein